MSYGNHWQTDREENKNSLFGDLNDAVEVRHPDLPQAPRWNTIERLNQEKDLIGIYLSAHPLDEFEYEVKEMCNITAEQLHAFDTWRTPENRKVIESSMLAERASEPTEEEPVIEDALDYAEDENADEAPQNVEQRPQPAPTATKEKKPTLPSEFIAKYEDKTCLLGGIITSAEQKVSKNNNPYGRYTIEDYSGSYTFALFGQAYTQFAHLLLKDVYVLVTGMIQQRGAGYKYHKKMPQAEAEYEFVVKKIDMLQDVQENLTDGLNVRIALNALTPQLINEMTEEIDQCPGDQRLHIQLYNPINRHLVPLTSRSKTIRVTPRFYKWLVMKRMEGVLDFNTVRAE